MAQTELPLIWNSFMSLIITLSKCYEESLAPAYRRYSVHMLLRLMRIPFRGGPWSGCFVFFPYTIVVQLDCAFYGIRLIQLSIAGLDSNIHSIPIFVGQPGRENY